MFTPAPPAWQISLFKGKICELGDLRSPAGRITMENLRLAPRA